MRLMMWRIPAHLRTDTGEAVPFSLAVLLSEESAAFHVSAEPSPSSRQQPSTDAALEEPQKQIWPRRTDLPLHRRSCRSSGNKRSCPQPGLFIRLSRQPLVFGELGFENFANYCFFSVCGLDKTGCEIVFRRDCTPLKSIAEKPPEAPFDQ